MGKLVTYVAAILLSAAATVIFMGMIGAPAEGAFAAGAVVAIAVGWVADYALWSKDVEEDHGA